MASETINVRVRCTKCQETSIAPIPRSGSVVLVPRELLCVKCWTPLKVMNPKLRHLGNHPPAGQPPEWTSLK